MGTSPGAKSRGPLVRVWAELGLGGELKSWFSGCGNLGLAGADHSHSGDLSMRSAPALLYQLSGATSRVPKAAPGTAACSAGHELTTEREGPPGPRNGKRVL